MARMDSPACAALLLFVATLMAMADNAHAAGQNLWVTNDGTDSSSCGSHAKPCRSISQGMENASDGDTIWVGAGHYGNVSGDSNFGGPGDEHPGFPSLNNHPQLDQPAGCIVCITKALHIYSLHGAAVTIIAGGPSTPFQSNVMIAHSGVGFGAKNYGFTITGGNEYGVSIAIALADTNADLGHITVAGNVDVNDTNGFVFDGEYDSPLYFSGCPPEDCRRTSPIVIADNEALNNGIGFRTTANADPGPVVLRGNLALGAGSGFVANAGLCPGCDVTDSGNNNDQVIGNVAAHCGTGFAMYEVGTIESNTASDNSGAGFKIDAPIQESFRGNSAIGNGGPGVIVNFSGDPFDLTPSGGGFSRFSGNNFFGNDRNRPALSLDGLGVAGLNPGPGAHCGVLNVGALAAIAGPVAVTPPPVMKIQAAKNFWGSSAGPAPDGPGDAVGGPVIRMVV